ncbi:Similar to B52: Serine-arginine protein 55 (Drosophila melanogaster) [Cotesia congregata]|uniref:Similar to B52: Serine-arginine protein 55 (Drosophila melanogaster) n=1 Tax=Cotesia congregata TaxID=51543 RepID=A0A8J2HHK0_COTCN|nr:Similar to B52: Serine-arginine protein 55 (Drosophila melanogaster) [Cotesia congregata]
MNTRVFVGGLTYRVRERDLENMVGTRVYVGGLPYGTRERDLERFFRGYGRFRDVLIKNGYGFVEFDDYRDADDAVYELNGKELLGERVAVEIARGVSGRRGDRGYGRSRSWRDKITVERARGTPRGSDQWRYGDSRGGYGDSRRSADSVNRNTRTASSYKQSLPRYGPPTRTEYRLTVENLSSRVSWQIRGEDVVPARQALDPAHDHAHVPVVVHALAHEVAAALAAVVAVAVAPNLEHTRNLNPNQSPSLLSAAVHVQSQNRSKSKSKSRSRSRSKNERSKSRSQSKSKAKSPSKERSSRERSRGDRSRSRSVSKHSKSHSRSRSPMNGVKSPQSNEDKED